MASVSASADVHNFNILDMVSVPKFSKERNQLPLSNAVKTIQKTAVTNNALS